MRACAKFLKARLCNERGELLNLMITPGDVDDRKPLEYKAFVEFIITPNIR